MVRSQNKLPVSSSIDLSFFARRAKNDKHRTYANHGFLPSVGSFAPYEAQKNLQKKKSTMLPQAKRRLRTEPRSSCDLQKSPK